nr:hypothetical protein [Tanacetum cinerariifolium]
MDYNFNNENEPWELSLDIDDSDLQLTHIVRSSSSIHVEPSLLTQNSVTIIPSPLSIVQLSSSTRIKPFSSISNPVRIIPSPAGLVQRTKLLKENVFILHPDGTLMSTQEYMQKVVEDVGKDADFNGTVPRTIHYKVLDVCSYGKDITVGAAMILANVLVFTPKPSEHYLNITKGNVVE